MSRIEVDLHKLGEQVAQTVAEDLEHATNAMNKKLGNYASGAPEVLGHMVGATALKFSCLILAQQIREGLESIAAAIEKKA